VKNIGKTHRRVIIELSNVWKKTFGKIKPGFKNAC
jgi:hypothetical protein